MMLLSGDARFSVGHARSRLKSIGQNLRRKDFGQAMRETARRVYVLVKSLVPLRVSDIRVQREDVIQDFHVFHQGQICMCCMLKNVIEPL